MDDVTETKVRIAFSTEDPQKLEAALKLIEMAIEDDPTESHYKYLKAIALSNLLKYDEANKILFELTRERPRIYENWLALGRNYHLKDNKSDALTCFYKAINILGDANELSFAVHNQIASLELDVGEPEKAIVSATKALELNPKWEEASNVLILAYKRISDDACARACATENSDDLVAALAAIERGIATGVDVDFYRHGKSRLLIQFGKHEKGREILHCLSECYSDQSVIFAELASSYEETGDLKSALSFYHKAAEAKCKSSLLTENFDLFYSKIAELELYTSSPEKALASAEKALEISPDNHQALDIKNKALEILKKTKH